MEQLESALERGGARREVGGERELEFFRFLDDSLAGRLFLRFFARWTDDDAKNAPKAEKRRKQGRKALLVKCAPDASS